MKYPSGLYNIIYVPSIRGPPYSVFYALSIWNTELEDSRGVSLIYRKGWAAEARGFN